MAASSAAFSRSKSASVSSPSSTQPSTPAAQKEPEKAAGGEATVLEPDKPRSPKVAAEGAAGSGPVTGAGSGDLLVEDLADVPDQDWRGDVGENRDQSGAQT